MAKRSVNKPNGFVLPQVVDIYSVNSCVNDDFMDDYTNFWKHNGFWFFDSPQVIKEVAREQGIDLTGTKLFYYEAYELEFNGEKWQPFSAGWNIPVNVVPPLHKQLEGFDVVTIWVENSPDPEHSPLSCNGLAQEIPTNSHCLIDSLEDAVDALNAGKFAGNDPGSQRVYAVYSVDWTVD